LITGSYDKHVKRISVDNRQVDKDFGQFCDYSINRIKVTADGEKLFVGDSIGLLKLISLIDGQVIKDFGQVHDGITGIMITEDQKSFFTSSNNGTFKQWNYNDNTLVRDHGKIINRSFSLC
jgi:WD40 repeat protein